MRQYKRVSRRQCGHILFNVQCDTSTQVPGNDVHDDKIHDKIHQTFY